MNTVREILDAERDQKLQEWKNGRWVDAPGVLLSRKAAPDGFRFHGNISTTNEDSAWRLKKYQADQDKFVIFNLAFNTHGTIEPECVAVYERM